MDSNIRYNMVCFINDVDSNKYSSRNINQSASEQFTICLQQPECLLFSKLILHI